MACALSLVAGFDPLSYFLADSQYESLVKAQPGTRKEVERLLFFYRSQQIDIRDSNWGKHTQLATGQICRQYLILGREPIDVVYNLNERVETIFPSYE